MKAAQISEYGDPSVVKVNEIDTPVISKGKLLVEVYASSLNPFDTTIRAGYMKDMMPLEMPVTLGGDIAGIVTELGDNVSNFAVGDKVYGQANVVAGNSGAFAEFAVTKSSQLAKMPESLDFQQAASVVLVGVSALQGVTEHIDIKPDQKIFIHGGAGGIGSIAIQIAKHIGAHVATTATGEGIEFVKQLGADEVIDYKAQDFTETLSDYDAVFDCVGSDDFVKTYAVLKKGGVAVSMIAPADEEKAIELGITAMTQSTQVKTERLDKLSELVENGTIKPQIDKVFPLDQIVEAFRARESGTIQGKVVLAIQ